MAFLRFTLLSEGSSDQALIPIIEWSIRQFAGFDLESQWADLRLLPHPPRGLDARIRTSVDLYPCDVLFVHRDADNTSREHRVREVANALAGLDDPPTVCVVPVRALEAWLLFDEPAIRRAAGNPNGQSDLALPRPSDVERLAKPKDVLKAAIQTASERTGRRRRQVKTGRALHRIAELTDDFSPLRQLSAFRAFESDLTQVLRSFFERDRSRSVTAT